MNSINKKRSLGQYFTTKHFWLKEHILEFIKYSNKKIAFDPFAGGGDLLNIAKKIGFKETKGFDIDDSLGWEINDSLLNIPKIDDSIIITNPPYLSNYSAKRKGIYSTVEKYFNNCNYDNIYQLALEKCLENNDFGIAIIPETFINSKFPKNRLVSITIIEDMMFDDTENPICVICFDNKNKNLKNIKLYKNDEFLGHLENFERMRKKPKKNIPIKFNSTNGQIALRAVDTTNIKKPIQFLQPNNIDYDLSTIKISSRLITLIELNIQKNQINQVIDTSNKILETFRINTHDILLSPFKGNKKNGERRRRLDYKTARAILEEAYNSINQIPSLFK
ncbi:MAG: hypothetical protein U9N76_00855 [Candidatus Marinimicrobia bacterium]|nr:hypothetical protein [Candidatus Neomarinimicrobiota bacterium]